MVHCGRLLAAALRLLEVHQTLRSCGAPMNNDSDQLQRW